MKSAYELAMERLQKQAPSIKLTDEQKARIAELESRYKARAAEREIGLADAINAAMSQGNWDEVRNLEQQLAHEKKKIAEELEEKKEGVRTGKA
jgi:Spy/CpxP family protein refolding chaperone